jgi:hypothetical protein
MRRSDVLKLTRGMVGGSRKSENEGCSREMVEINFHARKYRISYCFREQTASIWQPSVLSPTRYYQCHVMYISIIATKRNTPLIQITIHRLTSLSCFLNFSAAPYLILNTGSAFLSDWFLLIATIIIHIPLFSIDSSQHKSLVNIITVQTIFLSFTVSARKH